MQHERARRGTTLMRSVPTPLPALQRDIAKRDFNRSREPGGELPLWSLPKGPA